MVGRGCVWPFPDDFRIHSSTQREQGLSRIAFPPG
jgi:hypothetical protein